MRSKVLLVVAIAVVSYLVGCQLEVSGSAGTKVFYPDKLWGTKLGDPRRPMYEGSGYGERNTAGSESGTRGFGGLGKKGDE